ncbi:MAG: glycosyltransferase family 25 protein [Sediminibacterium sp.]
MNDHIEGYILGSVRELDRRQNLELLKTMLPSFVYEEAIYPEYVKVPFINRIKELAGQRTGHTMNSGEIGCLLSHRKIWKKIASHTEGNARMFMVLESDSSIRDINIVSKNFEKVSKDFDLFFWGAWEGHMKLFRSSKKILSGNYRVGEPFIKTVYCTYGYSLNRAAAIHLLKKTRKAGYTVDQFKRFIHKGDLRIGGVMPELITTTGRKSSYIQKNRNRVKEFFVWLLLDCKNTLICLLK